MEMKLTPRFYQDGERIFGPGVAELMQQVQVHQAISMAWAAERRDRCTCTCCISSATPGPKIRSPS